MVQMNNDDPVTNGLSQLSKHVQVEHKIIRSGIRGECQGLSGKDESQINEALGDVNDSWMEANQVQAHVRDSLWRPHQQPQGPVVFWERFLPFRSLKVLLAESDDSTCHVVSALLRKCGYDVTAVANGRQAWKILKDSNNCIDLVLTEVVMSCLSGIGLLCKLMNNNTCKKIPVIMMSSHDSLRIVFNCLTKGAVDFLLKPIRKNELKNLWHHVWRKCHRSSYIGSDSSIRTEKSTKSKDAEESNNTGSNDEDDSGIGLNGSHKGSGTLSSWTKRAVEGDSPQPKSPCERLADPPYSTCAQFINARPESLCNNWVPVTATWVYEGQDDELDHVVMGKDLEIGVPRNSNMQLENHAAKEPIYIAGITKDKTSDVHSKNGDDKLDKGQLKVDCGKANGSADPQMESLVFDIPNGFSKAFKMKDKPLYVAMEIPSIKLSLKRLRDAGETGTQCP
ncbi:Response_reg domain-containing protein [Cephalotus follicularis]|uniref:Response_reg domain-containing protein n=1 Tax=Cephalotus follicularis TaxID=3775 RepID=A0A1Q3B7G7_CEPFO|nr:Response_reg domain-containing protein [Cephalotus follicularis]